MFELHLFTIKISLKASFSLCLFVLVFFGVFLFILATLMLNINLSACHKIMVSTSRTSVFLS